MGETQRERDLQAAYLCVYTYHSHDLKPSTDLISSTTFLSTPEATRLYMTILTNHDKNENEGFLFEHIPQRKGHKTRACSARPTAILPHAPYSTKDTSKAAWSYDDARSKGPTVWVNRLKGRARHTRALGVRPTPHE